jgi:2-dehydropantoate 2-reductase
MKLGNTSRIAIVGTGSIGGTLGTLLKHRGNDVHMLVRSDYDVLKNDGMTIDFCDRETLVQKDLNIYRSSEEIGAVDLVIIALKTTANSVIPKVLPPLLHEKTIILTLQNGLGNMEFIQNAFPEHHICGGICYIGATRERSGYIRIFTPHIGTVLVGEQKGAAGDSMQLLAKWFQECGLKSKAVDNLQETLWRKLLWNIPFNGVAIEAGGVPTSTLLANPDLRNRLKVLMQEIQAAARPYGFYFSDEEIERQFPFTEGLGDYRPSTLMDFLKGVPIELDSMFKVPLRLGKAKGVFMPTLEKLTETLEEKTSSY